MIRNIDSCAFNKLMTWVVFISIFCANCITYLFNLFNFNLILGRRRGPTRLRRIFRISRRAGCNQNCWPLSGAVSVIVAHVTCVALSHISEVSCTSHISYVSHLTKIKYITCFSCIRCVISRLSRVSHFSRTSHISHISHVPHTSRICHVCHICHMSHLFHKCHICHMSHICHKCHICHDLSVSFLRLIPFQHLTLCHVFCQYYFVFWTHAAFLHHPFRYFMMLLTYAYPSLAYDTSHMSF